MTNFQWRSLFKKKSQFTDTILWVCFNVYWKILTMTLYIWPCFLFLEHPNTSSVSPFADTPFRVIRVFTNELIKWCVRLGWHPKCEMLGFLKDQDWENCYINKIIFTYDKSESYLRMYSVLTPDLLYNWHSCWEERNKEQPPSAGNIAPESCLTPLHFIYLFFTARLGL